MGGHTEYFADTQTTHGARDTTTRCALKIDDPSPGPGRVDFSAPEKKISQGAPDHKIRRGPSRNP